jgi:hypothetical protein
LSWLKAVFVEVSGLAASLAGRLFAHLPAVLQARFLRGAGIPKRTGLYDEAIAAITRGHTGRVSTGDADGLLADKWSRQASSLRLRRHRGAKRFRELLKGVAPADGPALVCYRGRENDGQVRGWEDMGPPPARRTRNGGRYNRPWRPVLYLCDSEAGVRREMGGKLCVQEYRLPLDHLRIADLASPDLHNFLCSAFDIAESAKVPGRSGLDTYRFGQLLANLVVRAGFDGMILPGVHGDPSFLYRNIVLFRPRRRWKSWSCKDVGFSC